jgi:plastocyanin
VERFGLAAGVLPALKVLAASACLALAVAACGGSGDDRAADRGGGQGETGVATGATMTADEEETAPTETSNGCSEAKAVDLTGDDASTIRITAATFMPDCALVSEGAPLRLVNKSPAAHNFHPFRTDLTVDVDAGATVEQELGLAPGLYDVVCTIHPGMVMGLVVT